MALTRAFISFDYDYDEDLKVMLVGQSRHSDTPFAIADHSIKEASPDWKEKARRRIKGCDVVVVLCGHYTDKAAGVAEELRIAKQEGIPYFLLAGRATGTNRKPSSAGTSDRLYNWTWENLKALIGGSR